MEIPYLKNSLDDADLREGPGAQGSLREGEDVDLDDILDADEQVDSGGIDFDVPTGALLLPLLLLRI